ncbi:MAG: DNA repair protein RecO [Cyclonatronaceae bacterium]
MIKKTPAIVLRSVDFRESSKIVTLFTQQEGKVSVMVRGAKSPNSKYAGLMQTGNILDVIYYHKISRSVQSLSDASYRQKTFNIQSDYEKLGVAMALLEMTDQLVHSHETSGDLFQFAESVLVWLHNAEGRIRNIFPYIQMRLAEHMGIGLQYDDNERSTANYVYMNINNGNFSVEPENEFCIRLTPLQTGYVKAVFGNKAASLLKKNLNVSDIRQLIYHMDVYLKHHIEGLKDRKSDVIFEQISMTT